MDNNSFPFENEKLRYAGFWRRILATLIDYLIVIIIIIPLLWFFYGVEYFTGDIDIVYFGSIEWIAWAGWADFLIGDIFPIFYTIALWLIYQATFGKMLL